MRGQNDALLCNNRLFFRWGMFFGWGTFWSYKLQSMRIQHGGLQSLCETERLDGETSSTGEMFFGWRTFFSSCKPGINVPAVLGVNELRNARTLGRQRLC